MIRMFRKSSLQYFYCLIQGLVFMIQLRKENNADILHMNSSFGQCTTRNFIGFFSKELLCKHYFHPSNIFSCPCSARKPSQ